MSTGSVWHAGRTRRHKIQASEEIPAQVFISVLLSKDSIMGKKHT
jgi:hypothetical protein